MAAGLAHELNNPAAAARRAAAQLAEALEVVGVDDRPLRRGRRRARATPSGSSRCSARRSRGREAATALDALDAADAEDELLERLEELGVPEPWRLAEPLAAAGVDEAWLDQRRRRSPARRPTPRCGWVAATLDRAAASPTELQESTAPDVRPRRAR